MVVLSAAVLSKVGKVLLSRQFVDMSRVRIEGLLSAFPKLMSTDKQHTFVETENVRYVYQPIETLYLVLITNKSSNIVEDLDTLRLIARLIPDVCGNLTEDQVLSKAFDLIFAFDEVISLGYKENLTIDQIKKFLEMDSHEEKLAIMIRQNKMKDAKDEMRRQAKIIQKEKALNPKGYKGGISSEDYRGSGGFNQSDSSDNSNDRHMSSSNNYIGNNNLKSFGSSSFNKPSTPTTLEPEKKAPQGMDLKQAMGKKQKGGLLQKIVDEESGPNKQLVEEQKPQQQQQVENSVSSPLSMESVHLKIGEKVTASISRDGAIDNIDLKGFLYMTLTDADNSFIRIQLRKDSNPAIKYTTNPKVDKQLFNDANLIGLKDTSKGFPTSKALEILRWNYQKRESDGLLPLTFNCWPSDDSISIEYNLDKSVGSVSDVVIAIPIPSNEVNVENVDSGDYKVQDGKLLWLIRNIDSNNKSGNIEFSCSGGDESSFFPISVTFQSQRSLSNVEIVDVANGANSASVKFTKEQILEGEISII